MLSLTQRLQLIRRRTIWCPTWMGTLCLALGLGIPLAWWFIRGEAFLSSADRLSAEVLVVEGWIGRDGVRAAGVEFAQRGYQYIVTTGGRTSAERWDEGGWSYAEGAEHELIRSRVPQDRIIVARAQDTDTQRTYESAVAVWRALQAKGIKPRTVNVFTFGSHARRSALVFGKVLGPETKVGAISWAPPGYSSTPWWHSSDRAREMITETAGYLFEAILNSGRRSNSPS
jgi:uncharacterized SAM-binding protein YcdF (DUF218 family)